MYGDFRELKKSIFKLVWIVKDYSKVYSNEIFLQVYSNKNTKQYLREITKAEKINKELSFQTARHTIATTVTLAHGVPIEKVSKLLGNTKL